MHTMRRTVSSKTRPFLWPKCELVLIVTEYANTVYRRLLNPRAIFGANRLNKPPLNGPCQWCGAEGWVPVVDG